MSAPDEDVCRPVSTTQRGLVCVRSHCSLAHPGHPGMGHCGGCLQEANEGANYFDPTFHDDEPPCCCRDERPIP